MVISLCSRPCIWLVACKVLGYVLDCCLTGLDYAFVHVCIHVCFEMFGLFRLYVMIGMICVYVLTLHFLGLVSL